jgi:hypothetical protein
MKADGKVVAAIGTAVTMYLAEEQAAERVARRSEARPVASPWGMAGRQELMRNRQMWQLRIVPR